MTATGVPDLSFTGERVVPGIPGLEELYFEHMARYLLADPLCRGKAVLDVACGAGYGSYHLATRGATSVLGVDRAPDAVAYARSRYAALGLSFMVADAAAIPVPAGTFDVVVSFETIEHVPSPERALEEFARVLGPDGLLIISTPNPARYGPAGWKGQNPFHTREFTVPEFREMLHAHFPAVRLYGQRHVQGLAVWGEGTVGTGPWLQVPLAPMDAGGIQPDRPQLPSVDSAIFLIAVCGRGANAKLPQPAWFFSYPTDVLGATRLHALSLSRENQQLREQAAGLARRGVALVQGGDLAAGISLLETVCATTLRGAALPNLAVAYAMAGRDPEAERAFQEALALAPEDCQLRQDAEAFRRRPGRPVSGPAEYQERPSSSVGAPPSAPGESADRRPSGTSRGHGAGLAQARGARDRGDWAAAAQGYIAVLCEDRGCAEARAGLGICLLALDDVEEGLAQLQEAARLEPTPDVVNDLACGLVHVGRLAEAEQLLSGILAIVPGHQAARVNLTRLREALGEVAGVTPAPGAAR